MNHKQALIIFWSLIGLMITGMSIVFTNPIHGQMNGSNPMLVYFIFFAVLAFIPIIILIPMIGSGRFHKEQKVKTE